MTTATKYSLDVDSPLKVAAILRQAAEAYRESHAELQAAWQDKHAGHEWPKIATALERAADRIDAITRPVTE